MRMNEQQPSFSLNLQDVFYILFRHKWKIILCSAAGFLAVGAFYYFQTPKYESRAVLLVRYILERSAIDSVESQSTGGKSGASVMNSEVAILRSWDLAVEAAEAIGVDKLVPGGTGSAGIRAAAGRINSGLIVATNQDNDCILLRYTDADPKLAPVILEELLNCYFRKHLEVHRSTGAFDFVAKQTDHVRGRLIQTETELKRLKEKAGVFYTFYTSNDLDQRMINRREQLLAAEAELFLQKAQVAEMEKYLAKKSKPVATDTADSADSEKSGELGDVQRYQALVARSRELRSVELELLGRYNPENPLLKSVRGQIEDIDRQRRDMEAKIPSIRLYSADNRTSNGAPIVNETVQWFEAKLATEKAKLAASKSKVAILKSQVDFIEERANEMSEFKSQIAQLERKRKAEEANYQYFQSSLEKARIDEALDPSKIPNISTVQKPSPPVPTVSDLKKPMAVLAAGGVAIGLAIAFLIELVLDRRVKRPSELETRMHVPLFLSIPLIPHRAQLRLDNRKDSKSLEKGAGSEVVPWDGSYFISSYANSIRDRLILWFRLKNLTQKPKLVGITGVAGGEGATTVAGCVAASLSETGEGKVLLVNWNTDRSNIHPFLNGKAALGLSEALEANGNLTPASENLYLATGACSNGDHRLLAPRQFYTLLPSLKASHYDYIIFDLPPVGRSSATLAMSSCLDKVLLIVEAEKSDRDQVKRSYTELVAARANVSAILNKTRETPIG